MDDVARVTADDNPVVGWGTTSTGEHVPIRRDVADAIWAAAEAKREAHLRYADRGGRHQRPQQRSRGCRNSVGSGQNMHRAECLAK